LLFFVVVRSFVCTRK